MVNYSKLDMVRSCTKIYQKTKAATLAAVVRTVRNTGPVLQFFVNAKTIRLFLLSKIICQSFNSEEAKKLLRI
jgi:hypothetical protein